jgi:hypothetical protein
VDKLNMFPVHHMLNTILEDIVDILKIHNQEQSDHVGNEFEFHHLNNSILVYMEHINLHKDTCLLNMKPVRTMQLNPEVRRQ